MRAVSGRSGRGGRTGARRPQARWSAALLLATVTWSAGSGTPAAAAQTLAATASADSLTVRELRPGVWLHTSWREIAPGVDLPANGLVVRSGDRLWLVNTAWGAPLTERLLAWIDAEIGLPVAGAVVTHFHDDSMGGMPVLAARGIRAWANPLTRELGAGAGVPLPDAIDGLAVGEAVPMESFEVFYPGPGHTEDNVMVWLPGARILFGGCAVRPAESSDLGNTADANLAEWPRSIARARVRYADAEVVIPSHGRPGSVALLDHTIRLGGGAR